MYNRILAIAILFLISTFASFSQTADEIVDKSIAASGGLDNYKSLKSAKMVAKMSAQGMEFGITIMIKKSAIRTEQEMMGQKMLQVTDGKNAWMMSPQSPEAQPLPAEAISDMKDQSLMATNKLLKYKEPGAKIEKQGKEKVDGVTCNKIKLTDKDGKSETMSIDADSYLIKKIVSEVNGTSVEFTLQDYKKTGKFNAPYKWIIKAGENQNMEINIATLEYDIPLDDALFTKPASSPKPQTPPVAPAK